MWGMYDELDLVVSEMVNIRMANDIPVITGIEYSSYVTLGKDRTRSEHTSAKCIFTR